jgi:hypothetical protein
MLSAEISDLQNMDGSHTIVGRVWGEEAELAKFHEAYENDRMHIYGYKGTPPIVYGSSHPAVTIVAPSIDKERDAADTLRLVFESLGGRILK